jgi:uncharacterized membrane protein YqaE (UPF0057 family)
MKKLLAGFVLFVFTVILLSSCGNSSKLAITKRHYRSGYYVNLGSKKQTTTATTSVKTPSIKVKEQIAPVIAARSESYTNANIPVAISEKSTIVKEIITPKRVQENSFISASSIPLTQKAFTENTRANNDISGSPGDGHNDRNSVSVPFVLIVLCAIFIPPLGVGLMYGIDSYFWIDLILTLLFFFPGMIFALIVVLM